MSRDLGHRLGMLRLWWGRTGHRIVCVGVCVTALLMALLFLGYTMHRSWTAQDEGRWGYTTAWCEVCGHDHRCAPFAQPVLLETFKETDDR